LILPVVHAWHEDISHACVSINFNRIRLRTAHYAQL